MGTSKIDPKAVIRGMFDDGSDVGQAAGEAKAIQRKRYGKPRKTKVGGPVTEFLKVDQVAQRYAISQATVWRLVQNDPEFPAPIKFTNGTSRWSLKQLRSFESVKEAATKTGKGARK